MTDEIKKMKCNRCKVLLPDYKFTKKKNDEYQKSCERCRGIQKEERENNKCPHKRLRNTCIECGGASICIHKRQRSQCIQCNGSSICIHKRRRSKCIECNGSQICIHKRRRQVCIECNGSSICEHKRRRNTCKVCKDAIKITIKNMIMSSKSKDKKYNRYDADNFIDKCFLEGLVEEYPNCYYEDCKIELQYVEYQDNLATVERIDNSIGHIKSNCVICCLKCNTMRKSNKIK